MLIAQDAGAGSGSFSLIMIVLLIAAMYFLMIRPQTRRRREAQQMQAGLALGDEIQTVGGLFGKVTAIDDESVTLEAAPGVSLRYARGAVARVVTRSSADGGDGSDHDDAPKSVESS